MDPFIGEIVMFGGNFAPRQWALCNGQLLAISSNSALFSILGTIYGGDGRTTFALPDLRGRAALHSGTGPGLSTIPLGARGGFENHRLSILEMPNHIHSGAALRGSILVNEEDATTDDPTNASLGIAQVSTGDISLYNTETNTKTMSPNSIQIQGDTSPAGGDQSFSIRNPFTAVNYIIALYGTYPSRN